MVVDAGREETKITTINGEKRNAIKQYTVIPYSFSELAKRIYNRFSSGKYDKIIVDANGIGAALVDELKREFDKRDLYFSPSSGKVLKKGYEITKTVSCLLTGDVINKDLSNPDDVF